MRRQLGFEPSRIGTVGAFGTYNRAKLARVICPAFGEYYAISGTSFLLVTSIMHMLSMPNRHETGLILLGIHGCTYTPGVVQGA